MTSRSPTRATGTPRRWKDTDPSGLSKRGSSTSTDSPSPRPVHGQRRVDAARLEVPVAQALVAEAVADRAVGDPHLARGGVDDRRLPHRRSRCHPRGGRCRRRRGTCRDARRRPRRLGPLEADQVGQVGEALVVVGEERDLLVDEVLLEDDVAHRHRQRAVGAGRGRHPLVGELDVLGVVGGDRDDLLAAVARLGHPVGVRRAGHRDVGAPHDQVARRPTSRRTRGRRSGRRTSAATRWAGRRTSRRTTASARR